jgi:hypothetical protein
MFVVSSSSLARFCVNGRDDAAIRRTFGVDFLLDGSIQRTRDRLRITLRLLDLRAGNQVAWAQRFDRQSNDLLSLQDEIASEVVAQIDPEILLIEAKRTASRPTVGADAYDLVLRALPAMNRMEHEPFLPLRLSRNMQRRMPGTRIGMCSWWGRTGLAIPRP